MQEAIVFIQWYALYHGLLLNHQKTEYKIFKKNGQINDASKINLYLSKEINEWILKTNVDLTNIKDKKLKLNKNTIKYLGIWLDTNLNFEDHAFKLEKKCYGIFHKIKRNLKRLWNINADIVWTILDMCILSILDYSAIIYPLMKKGTQKILQKVYKRIIKATFYCTKDTGLIHIYNQ